MQSSTHTTVAGVQEALLRLKEAVERLRAEYGDTLGVRRLTSDVQRLGADLEYDASMWSDAEQEGFGAPDRHVP